MTDEIKQEMKQAVVNMMHRALMSNGVHALTECIALLQVYEKASDPLIQLKLLPEEKIQEKVTSKDSEKSVQTKKVK